ncbi:MAG: DUF2079 domain-containing protein [Patescibacteria group bacterium]
MRLKSRFLTYCFLFIVWGIFCFLVAFSLWTQVYPQELKSFIFHGSISEKKVLYDFLKHLIVSSLALALVNVLILLFQYSKNKKRFSWIKGVWDQTKAMRPILFLFFSPLRVFVSIGNQTAWFDQTTFYFLLFFILVLSWVFYNLLKPINFSKIAIFEPRRIEIGVWSIFILSVLFWSYFSVLRSLDLTIEKPDSHAFISVFWNTAHGDLLTFTYLDGPRNWFGLHFEPLIFLFVPLYLVKIPTLPTPILLQLIQIVIGVSGFFPVFFLARKRLRSDFLGLIFGLVYLLFPAFQFQILYDFHIEIVSLVSVLWSIYFLEQKRYKLFFLFLVLAVFSREEFAIYASIFGLYLLFKKEPSKKLGFFLLTSGLCYLLLIKSLIIPYFGQGGLLPAQVGMYSHLGENLLKSARTPLSKLEYLLNFIFTQRKIQYLFLMFLPTGFLALLSPLVLFTLPFFLINLLLNFDLPSSIFWHYQSWLIPLLIWVTLDFVSRKRFKVAFCIFIFSTSFFSSLYFGPLNLLGFNLGNTHKGLFELRKSPEVSSFNQIKKLIPDEGSLAADTGLAPYFADRKDFYLFPDKTDTDYIVTSLKLFKNHPQLHSFLINGGYCLKGIEGILIYKKQKNCDYLWQDDLIDTGQPLLFKENDTKIIFAKNFFPLALPISPKNFNLPAILILKSSFGENLSSDNLIYLIDSEILAHSPSVVKIEASPDGENYQTVSICSASQSAYCISRVEVSGLVNKEGEIYLKLYLFADSLVAKAPTDVKVERIVLRSLKLTSGLK